MHGYRCSRISEGVLRRQQVVDQLLAVSSVLQMTRPPVPCKEAKREVSQCRLCRKICLCFVQDSHVCLLEAPLL